MPFSSNWLLKEKLEEGLLWSYEINKEYISVNVSLSRVKTLELLIA